MLRARDAMDRDFAGPLDVRSLASIACVSEAHFIRTFKSTFGETPHRYLQRRRIERAMFLLRTSAARLPRCVWTSASPASGRSAASSPKSLG